MDAKAKSLLESFIPDEYLGCIQGEEHGESNVERS